MRRFKFFLVGLIVLTVMVSLFSLLFPSTVKINRDTIVNAPPNQALAEISDLRNWPKWYTPLLDAGVAGIVFMPRAEGNSLLWNDANGNQNSILMVHSDSLFVEVKINSGNNKILQSRFILHPMDQGIHTRIEWQSLLDLGWLPWNKFKGIFAEELIAPVPESSLKNLKQLLETHNSTAISY